jgi:hypothetical protein
MPDLSLLDTAAMAVSASPWLTEVKALPIHFSPPSVNHFQRINNAFATIFSGAVYIFVSNTPGTLLLQVWPWWCFMLISAVCVCVLIGLLLWKIDDVNGGKAIWPLVLHSALYFVIFCSITLGCGLVKLLETNVHLVGKAVSAASGKPVAGARIQLYDESALRLEVRSNREGIYQTLLSKEVLAKMDGLRMEVLARGYDLKSITLSDEVMFMTQWQQVVLVQSEEDNP